MTSKKESASPSASLQFCDRPNQYARPSGLEKTGDTIQVHGYQEFSLSPGAIAPLPTDGPLLQKQNLVRRFFTPEFMRGKTMLDLGANGGFFSFWARQCGASRVTAVDLDGEYIRIVQAITTLLDLDRIETRKMLVQDCSEEADVVVAFAMVHWLYSCTASYGSLDTVLAKLRSLTRQLLIVEWISPDDPAIAMLQHTSWNSAIIQAPYNQDAFEDSLRRHFARVEVYGQTTPTRTLYIAWAQRHEIELNVELPLLAPQACVLSSRRLADCEGRSYFSRIYLMDDGATVLKQASYDLAIRERAMLDRLRGEGFPRALSAEPHADYSTLVLERIHGSNLNETLPSIAASPASLANFFKACLELLENLREAGILHRDIRPDNILVRNGRPVLIDFGWALLDGKSHLTPAGLGDTGRPLDGSFCDVYSMGKVFALACPRNTNLFQPLIAAMTAQERTQRTVKLGDLQAVLSNLALPETWVEPPRFAFITRDLAPLAAPATLPRKAAVAPKPYSTDATETLQQRAEALSDAARWPEAGGVYQELSRRLPDDLSAWTGRLACARKQGHAVLADIILEEALERHPQWAAALGESSDALRQAKGVQTQPAAPVQKLSAETPFQTPASAVSISDRMKRESNERAAEDARYFVRSTTREQSEAEFDASGRENVDNIVVADLPQVAAGRNPKTMTMLEIGCGVGRMSKHFARHFGQVQAIDVSGEMIRQARERLGAVANVTFHETGGADLALFADETFDLVFSFIVFQHIPDRAVIFNYIREAHRVLQPGGVFKFQVQGCTQMEWMEAPKDTWHGVTITEADVEALRSELGFDLLAKSGQGTQYSWYTLRKQIAQPRHLRPEPRRETAGNLLERAEQLCAQSNWKEAGEIYQVLTSRRPDDLADWRGRLECARQQGHSVMADLLLEEALENHPEWAAQLGVSPKTTTATLMHSESSRQAAR